MSVQHLLTGKIQSIQRKSYSTTTLWWPQLQHEQAWEETQASVKGHQLLSTSAKESGGNQIQDIKTQHNQ